MVVALYRDMDAGTGGKSTVRTIKIPYPDGVIFIDAVGGIGGDGGSGGNGACYVEP